MRILQGALALLVRLLHIHRSTISQISRYIADYVFALPTVAFFMCVIGVFIIGHSLSSLCLRLGIYKETGIWARMIAIVRYLSYRGFHVSVFRWNSAPVGVLVLGAIGATFFFCKSQCSHIERLRLLVSLLLDRYGPGT